MRALQDGLTALGLVPSGVLAESTALPIDGGLELRCGMKGPPFHLFFKNDIIDLYCSE